MDLNQTAVVITGASSGIGKALAYACAQRGWNVVLGARQYVTLCEIAQELEKEYNIRAVAVACDVTHEEECKVLMDQAIRSLGKIDVLINNAGISMRALFEEVDLKVLKQVMDINFWGTVYCTKYALPAILKSQGSIVGVSSIAGYKGLPGRTGYSASKFAMQGFLESVRIENLKKKIHVLIACPGFTSSNIRNVALNPQGTAQGESPLNEGKIMSAEAVAEAILKAVERRQRTLILTVQGKFTVMMSKFFPAFLDKLVYNHFRKEPDSPLK
jgi:short-subunit dehydrogenase